MFDTDRPMVTYHFHYDNSVDCSEYGFPATTRSTKTVSLDNTATWPTALREFVNFLSGIYGYDISSRVLIRNFEALSDEGTSGSISIADF